eukprot:tig00000350_g24342.t1
MAGQPISVQDYLTESVRPALVRALVDMVRSKTEDPYQYLSTWLAENNPRLSMQPPTPAPVRLHLSRISAPCQMVWWFCLENNIPCELVDVDFRRGEQYSPEFLAISPSGSVPAIDDGGVRVSEPGAIIRYLAGKHAVPSNWYSVGPYGAGVDAILEWNARRLYPAVGEDVAFPNALGSSEEVTDAVLQNAFERGCRAVDHGLRLVNSWLEGREYVAGPEISAADLAVFTSVATLEWANSDRFPRPYSIPWTELPALARWYQALSDRPAWRQIAGGPGGHLSYLAQFHRNAPNPTKDVPHEACPYPAPRPFPLPPAARYPPASSGEEEEDELAVPGGGRIVEA